MANTIVQLIFSDATNNYTFPLVQSVSDPIEGMKATIIEGNRGDGSIVIPSGKKSIEIAVNGILFDKDGYIDLTTMMSTMRSSVTTNPATLTLRHWNGTTWDNDWVYTVRRIEPIEFPESMRTGVQEYRVKFLVTSF